MKTLICFLTASTLFLGSYRCAHPQNDNTDREAIKMLTEFYTAYSSIKFIDQDSNRFYTLIIKYCTIELRKMAKIWFDAEDGYGADILTNDKGISKESLKTLKIVKDPRKENTYIVSYFKIKVPASGPPENQKIIFPVTLVKENGVFKIANVANVMHDYQ